MSGGLAAASWERLLVAAPIILGACLLIGLRARSLDGLLLGDAAAGHLGVDVKRERGILLVLATMTTAAAVAITGLIGFVGLVVPHVVRLLVEHGLSVNDADDRFKVTPLILAAEENHTEIVKFLKWALHDGQQYAEGLHYARLPQGLVERVEKKLAEVKVGK